MSCTLSGIQSDACISGIGREQNQIKLLQLIAQLTCEASQGGGGSGTPGGSNTEVQFNNAGSFGADAGFAYNGAGGATLSVSVTVPLVASAGALSFSSNGVTRANFSTGGHLLFNSDNTNDIGASGATRPRTVYGATSIVQGAGGGGGGVTLSGGFVTCANLSAVSAVAGTTASFTTITSIGLTSGGTLRTSTAYTVGTLPAAGTAGRRAYVTDALAPVWGSPVVAGGAVRVPVFDNGTAWIVG